MIEILESVKDPEVPVLSVVELGIVRDVVRRRGRSVDGGDHPHVFRVSRDACDRGGHHAALHAAGYADVSIRTVFSPAWTTEWIGDEAREKLRGVRHRARRGHLRRGEDDLIPLLRGAAEVVACPYCGSTATELKSEFGSTACKSIRFCNGCRQPFEQFKAI